MGAPISSARLPEIWKSAPPVQSRPAQAVRVHLGEEDAAASSSTAGLRRRELVPPDRRPRRFACFPTSHPLVESADGMSPLEVILSATLTRWISFWSVRSPPCLVARCVDLGCVFGPGPSRLPFAAQFHSFPTPYDLFSFDRQRQSVHA